MCRPPPVARRDDIACPRQFLLQRHVIKIASDRQVPTAIGPNKSLHQRFGICAGPVREVGECDFRKSDLLDAGGPHGPKQAAATQVGGDDPGNFPPYHLPCTPRPPAHLRPRPPRPPPPPHPPPP